MGFDPNNPFVVKLVADARAEGRILAESGTAKDKPRPKPKRQTRPALVEAEYISPGTWVVPVATVSESNERSKWSRTGRTIAARRAVSRALGPWLPALASFSAHYHCGFPLRVVFTRLGGRKLDRGNLATSLKAVEDALCLMTGCDDGDARWRAEWEQEPGGKVGVRITIEAIA